jgi:pimeloyl-ACP methyl ester carboxylesterase
MTSRRLHREQLTVAGLAATVVQPDDANGMALFCLPGGGIARQYFDLTGRDADGTLSMAEHLALRGFTVIGLDHPGCGESPAADDGWALTPGHVADRDAAALAELRARYPGLAIGVGHSMGAMITILVQDRIRCFDALALLGWSYSSHHGLPELDAVLSDMAPLAADSAVLTDEELVTLAQRHFGEPLPVPVAPSTTSGLLLRGLPISDEARRAAGAAGSALLAVCGLAAMLRVGGAELANVDVPVFLGFGEHDITGTARATAEEMPRCRDITIFELPGAGHNHNVAPTRAALWSRLASWAEAVSPRGPGQSEGT